jgi:alpha-L-fucosidase
LLLNIPLPASGEPDPEELKVLAGITEWMSINGEGIYSTRPWKINGEGPAMKVVIKPNGQEFDPNEGKKPDLGALDIRFTTKGKTLYALVQGWPIGEVVIQSLATNSPQNPEKAVDVRLLGRDEALKFTQDSTGLRVTLPSTKPPAADIGIGLRINFA